MNQMSWNFTKYCRKRWIVNEEKRELDKEAEEQSTRGQSCYLEMVIGSC